MWKLHYDGGYSTTLQTRPNLEWQIEQYIKRIPNAAMQYNYHIQSYEYDKEKNRIIGVKVKDECGSVSTLNADLVVDGSGASSLSSAWFKQQGIQVLEEKVKIGLSYVTKFFQLPNTKERDWTIKIVYPNPPHEKMRCIISKVEGKRYIVTINGYYNEIDEKEVLKTDNGFTALTKRLQLRTFMRKSRMPPNYPAPPSIMSQLLIGGDMIKSGICLKASYLLVTPFPGLIRFLVRE